MSGGNPATERACWRTFVLVVASASVTVLNVGLALAQAVPEDVPAYISFVPSALVLCLNLTAFWSALPAAVDRSSRERLKWSGLALIGPIWSACAWNSGWPTLAWVLTLVIAGGAAAVIWSLRPEAADAWRSTSTPSLQSVPSAADPGGEFSPPSSIGPRLANWPAAANDGWLLRMERRQADGIEVLECEWRIEFSAGEQQRSLHLPIAPVLSAIPQVECEPLDGVDVEITVGMVLSYGVRLDVRRPGNARDAASATIGVMLTAPTRADAA